MLGTQREGTVLIGGGGCGCAGLLTTVLDVGAAGGRSSATII